MKKGKRESSLHWLPKTFQIKQESLGYETQTSACNKYQLEIV